MMKKAAIVFAAATVAMSAMCAAPVFANDGMYRTEYSNYNINSNKMVIASAANVRSMPSTNSSVLNVYDYGTVIRVNGYTNGWYSLGMESPMGGIMTGYIRADLVADTNKELVPIIPQDAKKEQSRGCAVAEGQKYTTYVADGYLALRNAPSYDDSNEFGQLWNGSTVIVMDEPCGDYVLVTVTYSAKGEYGANMEGRVGYVNAKCLK